MKLKGHHVACRPGKKNRTKVAHFRYKIKRARQEFSKVWGEKRGGNAQKT